MPQFSAWTDERRIHVQELIRRLYSVVAELDQEFEAEGRRFTPDGHLVGSIGEVVAAYVFNLELYPPSTKTHDAKSDDGRKIQIKLTGGVKKVSLSSQPDYLIVLQLHDRVIRLVYNGPGEAVWENCGEMGRNGQRPIGLKRLIELNGRVIDSDRIEQFNEFPPLA